MGMSNAHRSSLENNAVPDKRDKDMAGKPLPFFWAWGLPMMILVATNSMSGFVPLTIIVLIIVAALIWMGTACVHNARRCRRRHCYYSGPIFLIGALAALVVGFHVIDLGPDGLSIVVGVTVVAALATYGTEYIWGPYVGPK